MEDDTSTDTTTHRTEQGQGASNEATNTTTPLTTKDGKDDAETEQGNYSSTQTKGAANTPTNDTITSLAELRPGGEVHFRTLKEVDAKAKQDVQIIRKTGERKDANIPGSLP